MSLSEEEAALADGEQGPRVRIGWGKLDWEWVCFSQIFLDWNWWLAFLIFFWIEMRLMVCLSQIFVGNTVQRNWWMENGWMDVHFGPWERTHVCMTYVCWGIRMTQLEMKLYLRFDFFKVPRLPTLPAAVVQIFLCLAQIGRNWAIIEPLTHKKTFQFWCFCCRPSTTPTSLMSIFLAPSLSWSTPTLATGPPSWPSTSSYSNTTTTLDSRFLNWG